MIVPPTKYFEAPGTASKAALTRPPQLPSATATVWPRAFNLFATVVARAGSSTPRSVRRRDARFRNGAISKYTRFGMDDAAIDRRRWWALAVMCTSLAVISLDNTVLNVAIPALVR